MPRTISRQDWDKTPPEYKSVIDGVPHILSNGGALGTILEPVEIIEPCPYCGPDCTSLTHPHTLTTILEASAYERLIALGFARYETGGGCTALRRAYPDGSYHLITLEDNPATAPDPWDSDEIAVRLGFYGPEDSEPTADDTAMPLWAAAGLFEDNAQEGGAS